MIKELPDSDEVVSAAEVLIAVFGFGMDLAGAWRNPPSIHALKEARD